MFENIFPKYITAKNIIFFIIAILFLIFVAKIKDVAILFFASYVIACSLNPLVDKLSQKFNRKVSSALVLVATLVLIGLFFIPIIKDTTLLVKQNDGYYFNQKHIPKLQWIFCFLILRMQ